MPAPQSNSPNDEKLILDRRIQVGEEREDRLLCQPVSIQVEGNQENEEENNEDAPSNHQYQTIECRNFWKAGSYEARPMPSQAQRGQLESSDFDRARVNPRFLHSNATSHKWAFGAIAEIMDNAVDEICNGATFVKVDKVHNMRDDNPALLFQDDGGGMDPEGIRRCMSLGFSSKKTNTTIGQYGNGFKTSTMRLGADAIVFSRANRGGNATQSIGLLSYTFLTRTIRDDIIVPMVDFEIHEDRAVPLIYGSQADWDFNMNTILDWSPFSSKEKLMLQFEDIGFHGTKVLIYNLWYDDDGLLELDFNDDDDDIRLRDRAKGGAISKEKNEIIQSHISYTYLYSLRAYASILYRREFPNFCIILRGKPVQQLNIVNEMKFSKVVSYRPHVMLDSTEVLVEVTIGFAKEAPVLGMYGINIYHKNRLIMPFWKVYQEGSSKGRCVVGVLEANFIEPAHDKQDFERSPLFIRLETRLKHMIQDYWKNNCHRIGYQSPYEGIRGMQKESNKRSHVRAPDMPQELASEQHVTRLSANLQQGITVEEPIIGLAANFQKAPTVQPIIGLAAVNGSTVPSPVQDLSQHSNMESSLLEEDSVEDSEPVDNLNSTSIEKMREENIQLFMKRNELRRKERELKQTIEKLENELKEARQNCSKLASDLDIRRKAAGCKVPK